ncbi:hypothetical protein Hanom_Chr11g01037431 [Helianthus anomalus]
MHTNKTRLIHNNQFKISLTGHLIAMAKLEISDRGSKTYIPKYFYKTRGSKTYIPKIFYTKTTYSPLLNEKFVGRLPSPAPIILRPCLIVSQVCSLPSLHS